MVTITTEKAEDQIVIRMDSEEAKLLRFVAWKYRSEIAKVEDKSTFFVDRLRVLLSEHL